MKSISYEEACALGGSDFINSTFFPEAQPKVNEWLRFINTPVLNLNLVNDSFIGNTIKESYISKPYETLQMIRDMYRDNPTLTIEIISNHNCKLIGL